MNSSSTIFLAIFNLLTLLLHKSDGVLNKGDVVKQVHFGKKAVLECPSNDDDHIFQFWIVANRNLIIGPTNEYDKSKYDYQTLSGNLTIRAVSKGEEGLYSCVSQQVKGQELNVRHVKVIVIFDWEEVYNHDSQINVIRILIALITLVIVAGVVYFGYRMYKERYRYPGYLEQSEEEDDEESVEEIFSAPSTSAGSFRNAGNIIIEKKQNEFDGISTDFKSILDVANNK